MRGAAGDPAEHRRVLRPERPVRCPARGDPPGAHRGDRLLHLPVHPAPGARLPGVLSGLTDPTAPGNRRRVLTGVGLFILGFAAVFTLYGAAFGAIGGWLLRWQDLMIRILGVFVIGMGLALIGRLPFLQATTKPSWQPRRGLAVKRPGFRSVVRRSRARSSWCECRPLRLPLECGSRAPRGAGSCSTSGPSPSSPTRLR